MRGQYSPSRPQWRNKLKVIRGLILIKQQLQLPTLDLLYHYIFIDSITVASNTTIRTKEVGLLLVWRTIFKSTAQRENVWKRSIVQYGEDARVPGTGVFSGGCLVLPGKLMAVQDHSPLPSTWFTAAWKSRTDSITREVHLVPRTATGYESCNDNRPFWDTLNKVLSTLYTSSV